MSKCAHDYAYAGTVHFKNLEIEVYVCERCEHVHVKKRRVFPIGF